MAGQKQKVLLITMGATPQVVTETIWALAGQQPAWLPDRVILLTTQKGAAGLSGVMPLLDEELARLGAFLGVPDLPARVEMAVARDGSGQPLDDLRSADDVEAFAESLMRRVVSLTSRPETVLHLSMAGGRKTMSFTAGQVMSLFARAQDTLSHVLVHPAVLESRADFWWPDGRYPHARIELHDVPFIRLRGWLGGARLRDMAGAGFAGAVALANGAVGEARASLHLEGGTLQIGGREVHLAPREAAILAFVAIAGMRGQVVTTPKRWHPEYPKWTALALDGDRLAAARLWAWLATACDVKRLFEIRPPVSLQPFGRAASRLERRMVNGDEGAEPSHPYGELIGQPLSRLRRKLRDGLPVMLAERVMERRRLVCALSETLTIHGPAMLREHAGWPAEVIA